MNSAQLIGRLTRDPDLRYTSGSQMAVTRFTLAVDRLRGSQSDEKQADYISIVCFGKVAETVNQYAYKGMRVGIEGRIQTGSYEKDGRKVYTTDVVASRVEFLERREEHHAGGWSGGYQSQPQYAAPDYTKEIPQRPAERQMGMMDMPPDFESIDDDTPF